MLFLQENPLFHAETMATRFKGYVTPVFLEEAPIYFTRPWTKQHGSIKILSNVQQSMPSSQGYNGLLLQAWTLYY